jgi:type VI secretion system protein ImpH
MGYAAFAEFLPGHQALKELVDLTRLYVGPELDFDVQCIVRHDEVLACRLGGDKIYEPRLGWNTWLMHEDRQENARDPVFVSDIARVTPSTT